MEHDRQQTPAERARRRWSSPVAQSREDGTEPSPAAFDPTDALSAALLDVPDLSITPDLEEQLRHPAFRAVLEFELQAGTILHPRLLYRLTDSLAGRQPAGWFTAKNRVRLHFSLGTWDRDPEAQVTQFALSASRVLGAATPARVVRRELVPFQANPAGAIKHHLGLASLWDYSDSTD